jgi:hypothetical protein
MATGYKVKLLKLRRPKNTTAKIILKKLKIILVVRIKCITFVRVKNLSKV